MAGGAIYIIEEKPAQKKINVSIANKKSSGSTYKYSETYEARFVDGSSGRPGNREDTNYKSTHKVNDKPHSGEIRKNSSSTYKYSSGSSSRVTEKAVVFVDGRSGREENREETNYKSTHKLNGKAHSGEIRKSSRTYKNKAGDRRSGREERREEVNYKSYYKVNDKAHGVTIEVETSVKYKKTTTYDNSNNKSVTKY